MVSLELLKKAFESIVEPVTGKTLGELRAIVGVEKKSEKETCVRLRFGFPAEKLLGEIERQIAEEFHESNAGDLSFDVTTQILSHRVKAGLKPLKGVKNILAVTSAKGGVGKSTVAVNLALALKRIGVRVGILDADIYGPSVPLLLGVTGKPTPVDEKAMKPVDFHGVPVNSIGFFVSENEPLAWRGPVASRAIRDLAEKTEWGELDYLVIDFPPGTGDIQLTLAQSVPLTAALVVTTPQTLACADAARGLRLFEKVGIPVLGIVENMAYYRCPGCQRIDYLFGRGRTDALSNQFGVPLLGSIPITAKATSTLGEEGVEEKKVELTAFDEEIEKIAIRTVASLSRMPRDWTSVMPGVKVDMGTDKTS